ncbi:MAG: DUF4391 domain-containing protein [Pseudomonadota bacterium]|nr:DUF4391 domain-containing protein [Pseudomonadota bacterium]
MTADDVIRAFGLPASALQRTPVPKEAIARRVMGSDRRALLDGLRSLVWVAVIKPGSVAIPAFSDATRDYGEVLVFRATLRPGVTSARVVGPIHRAVSYPTAVVAEGDEGVSVSFAHVRRHERRPDAVVMDGEVRLVPLRDEEADGHFLASLPVAASSGTHLHALYEGWVERAEALAVSRVTGAFRPPTGPEAAQVRRERFHTVLALDETIAANVRLAQRARALAERVSLNNQIAELRERRSALIALLTAS